MMKDPNKFMENLNDYKRIIDETSEKLVGNFAAI